ncbi:Protein gir2 [Oleoguttula sp. CCFEE 5521]
MGLEDQAEEREVLSSIFPDEITDVDESSYRISMLLDITPQAGDDTIPPTLLLNVKYPSTYPDIAPGLDISQPPNAPKHPHLDVHEDKARLLEALEPVIEENLGMAMIFALYSSLKDSAEALITLRQNAEEAKHEAVKRQAEAEENRKFEGEKVTRESFLKWSDGFKREIEEAKVRRVLEVEAEEKKKRGRVEEKKLTGKQLWEQGLVGKVVEDEDEEDGVDAVGEGLKDVEVEG